jgi:maltooligosyltrehalose synthase
MGYDISDYKDIDPKYGTLADVDELIAKLGERDMKLMMDLVVNHTSDQVINSPMRRCQTSDCALASLVSRVTLVDR